MNIKFWHVSLLIMMMTITAACGPATETGEPATVPAGVLEVATQPAPVAATEAAPQPDAPEAYPSQPTAVPQTDGYPAPAAPVATIDPYPGAVDGFIWMLLPVGVQCEDDASLYTDLQDAIAGLTAVSVQTGQSEITELMVCTACGCPTSAHFRLQIDAGYLGNAQVLGWFAEE